ncbi:MAG: rod shape-determining protein MreD [Thermodesulfobacteriota bacterium]
MNQTLTYISLVLVSIVLITVQTTLLSPRKVGPLFPDLNLIFIVFLAVFSELRGSFLIAAGNGYMMDVFSGNLPGTFTISRLSAYLLVRTSSNHFYLKKMMVLGLVIFIATIFTWTFIFTIIRIKGDTGFEFSFSDVAIQGLINTVVGVPLFWAADRIHARFQK